MLRRIQAGGMCIARHKCLFFQEEIKFLGHIQFVGANGVRSDPEKVQAMRNMSNPVTYGRADKKLSAPLVECTKANADMTWDSRRQKAYDFLKEAMCSAELAAHPDFNLPFVLYTDASQTACSGIHTQFKPVPPLTSKQTASDPVPGR
jgi:RNase H-like domain found in reverse transcriptase